MGLKKYIHRYMKRLTVVCIMMPLISPSGLLAAEDAGMADPRRLENGKLIPIPGMKYVDQPYPLMLNGGTWLCMVTVGPEREARPGNHSVVLLSNDQGETWSDPVRCTSTYAVPFQTASGRIYAIQPKAITYSDDLGKTWSGTISVPNSVSKIDGRTGWGVAKPVVVGQSLFLPWAYIGQSPPPMKTEVFFNVSDNILTEADARRVTWERLPSGRQGLRGPDWERPKNRSEEPHLVVLSDGTLYAVWRTDQGFIGTATSRDEGKTWSKSGYVRYADGRLIKHPLACSSLWKCSNGKFLLYFHNHNHNSLSKEGNPYRDRNPAWISGGVEKDGQIVWSQPEILLYSDDQSYHSGRISYPGFLEGDGRYWIFETQKTIARSHEIDPTLLQGLWSQLERKGRVVEEGLVLNLQGKAAQVNQVNMPKLPDLSTGGSGFTIDVLVKNDDFKEGQVILDSRDEKGAGIALEIAEKGAVRLYFSDGKNKAGDWISDPGLLKAGQTHHVTAIVDGGPNIITFVVDGKLCDGGDARQYGWGRFDKKVGDVNVSDKLRLSPSFDGKLMGLRVYDRYLRISEAVANYKSGRGVGQ